MQTADLEGGWSEQRSKKKLRQPDLEGKGSKAGKGAGDSGGRSGRGGGMSTGSSSYYIEGSAVIRSCDNCRYPESCPDDCRYHGTGRGGMKRVGKGGGRGSGRGSPGGGSSHGSG